MKRKLIKTLLLIILAPACSRPWDDHRQCLRKYQRAVLAGSLGYFRPTAGYRGSGCHAADVRINRQHQCCAGHFAARCHFGLLLHSDSGLIARLSLLLKSLFRHRSSLL